MDNEKIVKQLQFADYETFHYALSGQRIDLLQALRSIGKVTVTVLSTHIKRPRSDVAKDLETLVMAGFVAELPGQEYSVPWAELITNISLTRDPMKVKLYGTQ